MAAGTRKIKITQIKIARATPVTYEATWEYWVEDVLGVDTISTGGTHAGSFGTAAAWRAMTGLQMENQVKADVAAANGIPARDSVT